MSSAVYHAFLNNKSIPSISILSVKDLLKINSDFAKKYIEAKAVSILMGANHQLSTNKVACSSVTIVFPNIVPNNFHLKQEYQTSIEMPKIL
jgi:hypothetical protein